MPQLLESMRYKGPKAAHKTLWLNEVREWATLRGHTLPTRSAVTWIDEGSPWLVFTVEDVAYNVAVDTSPTAMGP
jgi:hypothetical protein